MTKALSEAIQRAAENVAETIPVAHPSNDLRADIWREIEDAIKPAGEDLERVAKLYAKAWSRLWFLVQEIRDNPDTVNPDLCQIAMEDNYIDDDAPDVRRVLEGYDTREEAGWWKPRPSNAGGERRLAPKGNDEHRQ